MKKAILNAFFTNHKDKFFSISVFAIFSGLVGTVNKNSKYIIKVMRVNLLLQERAIIRFRNKLIYIYVLFVTKVLNKSFFEIQEGIIMGSILLTLIKLIFWSFSWVPHPMLNLSLFIFLSGFSIKKRLLFDFRERIIIPLLDKILGFNYYRHNVYGVIPDLELLFEYKSYYFSNIYFYLVYYFQNYIGRPFFLFLITIRLCFLKYPYLFLTLQNIAFYFLLINELTIYTIILTFIFNIAKIVFFMSDITFNIFKQKLQEILNIDLDKETIKFTKQNITLIGFFCLRSLEDRSIFLESFFIPYEQDYIEEKKETHNLTLKVNTKNKKKRYLIKLIIIIVYFFLITLIIFLGKNSTSDILMCNPLLGFLPKNSWLVSNYKIYSRCSGHYVTYHKIDETNGQVRLLVQPFLSVDKNAKGTLIHQNVEHIGVNINSNYQTGYSTNYPEIIISQQEYNNLHNELSNNFNLQNPITKQLMQNNFLTKIQEIMDFQSQFRDENGIFIPKNDMVLTTDKMQNDILHNIHHIKTAIKLPPKMHNDYRTIFNMQNNNKTKQSIKSDFFDFVKDVQNQNISNPNIVGYSKLTNILKKTIF